MNEKEEMGNGKGQVPYIDEPFVMPETWVTYTYDAVGNIESKKDAHGNLLDLEDM